MSQFAVSFKGAPTSLKHITQEEIEDLKGKYGGLGTNLSEKLSVLADDLKQSLGEFHKNGFAFGDAGVVRDVVGNLQMLSEVISEDDCTNSELNFLQEALKQSINELTKLAVDLSKQNNPTQLVQVPVSTQWTALSHQLEKNRKENEAGGSHGPSTDLSNSVDGRPFEVENQVKDNDDKNITHSESSEKKDFLEKNDAKVQTLTDVIVQKLQETNTDPLKIAAFQSL